MGPTETFLLDNPVLGILTFISIAILATLALYGVTRIFLGSRTIGGDAEMLSGRVITRLGALHALILALMFAQEMGDYRDITRVVSKEAGAIGDVFNGLREYDKTSQQSTTEIRGFIVDFVETTLDADRIALADHQLSNQSFDNYHRINRQLRNLKFDNSDQEYLRAQMLSDWDTVSDFHLRLRTISEYEAPGFFWVVIIVGFLTVVIPFYVYSPSLANLVILSTYAAFYGLVMYVIYSIANPFTGALAIDSHIFENLLRVWNETAF